MPGNKSAPLTKMCIHCGSPFLTTEKRAWRTNYCSNVCQVNAKESIQAKKIEARTRTCLTCECKFIARWAQIRNTGAKFCSNRCSTLPRLSEMSEKGHEALKIARAEGRIKLPKGPENKQWKGGPKASMARAIADGRAAARVKKYREKYPEKVKEFTQTRRGRKLTRLPRGTISKLLHAQGSKCAVCGVDVTNGYHVDHWVPLALGGEHKPENLKILCQHCNCVKNAKLPERFIREAMTSDVLCRRYGEGGISFDFARMLEQLWSTGIVVVTE